MLLAVLVGCTPDPVVPPPPGDDDDTVPPVLSTSPPTGTTGATGDTAASIPTETLDCSILPEPTLVRFHEYVDSSEDFTFDTEGYLWGVSTVTQALIRTPLDGVDELMKPNVSSWGRGTRILPGSGDLVVAEPDNGAVIRIDRDTMGVTILAGGFNQPNGIAVRDDGMLFVTQASGRVMRVDPDTGEQTLVYATPQSTDGITFDPTFDHLYWDSEAGEVIVGELDDAGDLVADPTVLTTIVAPILDGMAADACGNLYVVDMTGVIHRVKPDGTDEVYVSVNSHPNGGFVCAVNFGSGFGGWERDHLYVMSLSGGLFEVDVGIPGRWEPHLPTE
ncbi:MAG: SMP-30/gluconolactonase/LRE family protein [Myxococcota bacterium]